MFVHDKSLQVNVMFVIEAWDYPIEVPLRSSTLG